MIREGQSPAPGYLEFRQRQQGRVASLRRILEEIYPDPVSLVLEIGCGHGHYLVAYGQQHPEARCLGIDLVTRRIEKACQKRDKRNVRNVYFYKAEAGELFMAWPKRLGLERIFILFPDPWPKKRHHKNRIIQTALLDQLACFSQSGTCLHFRTDHDQAYIWSRELIQAHPAWKLDNAVDWPFEKPTYFQELFSGYQSLTAVRT